MTKDHPASHFAARHHAGSKEYDNQSYVEGHLREVVNQLMQAGFADPDMIGAGWLHDVVEDTQITVEEVRAEFGDGVANLVWAVTNEPGKNRKERAFATYPKIRAAGTRAVVLKLCDRLVNGEVSLRTRSPLFQMYTREYPVFRLALYHVDDGPQVLDLWARLDTLFLRETA